MGFGIVEVARGHCLLVGGRGDGGFGGRGGHGGDLGGGAAVAPLELQLLVELRMKGIKLSYLRIIYTGDYTRIQHTYYFALANFQSHFRAGTIDCHFCPIQSIPNCSL